MPVGWSTWVAQNVLDDAKSAGGLQVATVQVANTVGAGLGGLVLDIGGAAAPVVAAGALLGLTGLIVSALEVGYQPVREPDQLDVALALTLRKRYADEG
ncbi:Purine ribonucleoside efflux pump NepI [Methylorubrum aminovorans]|uniref:Purine ribonucleoside efflux pump NepI n=1 Tax=Methylorubrum aminovorans TaxID=269069 RepID=A0ABQ4UKT6_9HYPH|nr:hypothetical protein [Methylorubrum aminovorans]GJE67422.1 Purine ribonucleoside efflux pump NepI [Methylorubrum aminovorans]GMA74801.1 hypothetical protein GCM10025880_12180 [Methylorubrum aminovorans]